MLAPASPRLLVYDLPMDIFFNIFTLKRRSRKKILGEPFFLYQMIVQLKNKIFTATR